MEAGTKFGITVTCERSEINGEDYCCVLNYNYSNLQKIALSETEKSSGQDVFCSIRNRFPNNMLSETSCVKNEFCCKVFVQRSTKCLNSNCVYYVNIKEFLMSATRYIFFVFYFRANNLTLTKIRQVRNV